VRLFFYTNGLLLNLFLPTFWKFCKINNTKYFVLYLRHSCSAGFSLSVFVMLDPATQKCKVSKSRFCSVYRRTSYIKHTWCFDSARNNMRVNIVVNSTTLCCVAVSVRTSTYDRSSDLSFFALTESLQNLAQQKRSTLEDIILHIYSETCNKETRIYSKLSHWYIST
jgi:hypothetical protein